MPLEYEFALVFLTTSRAAPETSVIDKAGWQTAGTLCRMDVDDGSRPLGGGVRISSLVGSLLRTSAPMARSRSANPPFPMSPSVVVVVLVVLVVHRATSHLALSRARSLSLSF